MPGRNGAPLASPGPRTGAHPPAFRWLAYRVADAPLPPAWRQWARDDITGRWYPARRALAWSLVLAVLALVFPVPGKAWFWPSLMAAEFASEAVWARWTRRRMLRKHQARTGS